MRQLIKAGIDAGLPMQTILNELGEFVEHRSIDFFDNPYAVKFSVITTGIFNQSHKIKAFAIDYDKGKYYCRERGQLGTLQQLLKD